MFQSSSQTIMNLDSRICQLDVKDYMLLVSTLTRCYICDTEKEQYRQIGQKLRDGEYGACFVTTENKLQNDTSNEENKDYTEVKKFNIVDDDQAFHVSDKLANTAIMCARPSSRLWEASIDGTVKRTHQYKQVLARQPLKIISMESYNNENVTIEGFSKENEGQSCNFPRIYSIKNSAIFSYKKDALYFLDIQDVDNTIWYDTYKDIVDCKLYHDLLYLWLQNGSLICLRFMKLEKFLVKCYLDEKYVLCTELCALFSNYLLSSNTLSTKLHILVGLRDKLQNKEDLNKIEEVLSKFEGLKVNDATQMKSGIYVVDNTYHTKESLLSDEEEYTNITDENKYTHLPPEAVQAFKDLSVSMSDKLSTSKKILKEKWGDFEEKMKHLSGDKPQVQEAVVAKRVVPEISTKCSNDSASGEPSIPLYDRDIIYKESSQKAIELDNEAIEKDKLTTERDKLCKSLYQHFRLSLVGKETENSNLLYILESCDIKEIYYVMLLLEEYCVSIGALEESKFAPNNIFLNYLEISPKRIELLDDIINNEDLYKYFVDSCISVNMKTQKLSNMGCECGFPLPYMRTNKTPIFSEIIDQFVERQWSSQTEEQCYGICKRMPYLWRKILYLRRNEDLLNLLQLILQMLDENLLHSFLPQFTLETWDRAVQLYAVLHANRCLNCNKSFDHISVKQTLSWDDIGALMIKSIGGRKPLKVMEKHAELIGIGAISMRFYHTCFLVTLYENYDSIIVNQLTDTIYSSYAFEDAVQDVSKNQHDF